MGLFKPPGWKTPPLLLARMSASLIATMRSRREVIRWAAAVGGIPRLILGDPNSNRSPTYDEIEAYAVYSTLIPEDWIWVVAKAEFLVIAGLTVSSEMCLSPEGESARILAPAIANYKELATRRWQLTRNFSLSRPYTLVGGQELDTYFSKGGRGWDGFYARYPKSGGYLFLSPVGFNASKDVAVVQVNHSCGGLCGGGSFSVLQKKDGEWKQMNWHGSLCAWAS